MQLDTRQAQFFMQSYSQTYSPIHQENIIEVVDWDWTDYDDFIDRFYNDNRKKAVWNSVMLVYDGFNVLRNEDFIDAKLLYEMSQCGTKGATLVWFRYMPVIVEMRVRDNNPCMLRNLEGHVEEMVRLRKLNGLPSVWSEEHKFFTSK